MHNKTYLLVAFFLVALDQISKILVLILSVIKKEKVLIKTPTLDIHLIINKGISYGMFQINHWLWKCFLSILTAIIIFFLFKLFLNAKNKRKKIGFVFIISGAMGNLLDRIFHGGVVDFLSFHFNGFYWYIFNIADIWIVVGALFVWIGYYEYKKR